MSYNAEFRAALERGDLQELVGIWRKAAPHFPLPSSKADLEFVMHRARTECAFIRFDARAYSHAWLRERNLPSGMPDHLKPRAERLYPRIAEGVGVSVNFKSPAIKPAGALIEKKMTDAIADVYSDNLHPDPELVKKQMRNARAKEEKALFGKLFNPLKE